jgi:hypothetical protein
VSIGPSRDAASRFKSPPAQKCAPSPRRITQRSAGSESNALNTSTPAAYTCGDSVLRVAGSLIVRISVWSRRSVRSSDGMGRFKPRAA